MKTIEAEGATEWFVAQTGSLGERMAKAHLERQGFGVYLPMRACLKKRTGQATAFLPRYLFVAVEAIRPRWHDIVATPGVVSLVRRAGAIEPARVPASLVDAIKAREVYGLVTLPPKVVKPAPPFKPGEAVHVKLPLLLDDKTPSEVVYDALFDHVIDARRVAVLLTFCQRQVRVDVAARAVRKAG